jgi:hypothetical protein
LRILAQSPRCRSPRCKTSGAWVSWLEFPGPPFRYFGSMRSHSRGVATDAQPTSGPTGRQNPSSDVDLDTSTAQPNSPKISRLFAMMRTHQTPCSPSTAADSVSFAPSSDPSAPSTTPGADSDPRERSAQPLPEFAPSPHLLGRFERCDTWGTNCTTGSEQNIPRSENTRQQLREPTDKDLIGPEDDEWGTASGSETSSATTQSRGYPDLSYGAPDRGEDTRRLTELGDNHSSHWYPPTTNTNDTQWGA